MIKCIEMDCNNKRMKNKTYCSDCESFVLSEKENNKINKLWDKAQEQTLKLKDMEIHDLDQKNNKEKYECLKEFEKCCRCGEQAELESELGLLCNDCDCKRISLEDYKGTDKEIKEFEKECGVKK